MGTVEVFALQLGEGWVLCRPEMDRLMVLNATGKIVWDLLGDGFDQQKIASIFARHFGLPASVALAHIEEVISGLEGAGVLACPPGDVPRAATPRPCTSGPALHIGPGLNCGTYRFGDRRIQMRSALPDIGRDYFSRFWHRAMDEAVDAEVLTFTGWPGAYRLTFQDAAAADAGSLAGLMASADELLLSWEHPKTEFLATFHAAAVSYGGRSVLLPGVSGSGKSTLTAYLAGHGFAYLGDDLIAMARADWSLRALPTCLSIKSGSWPILTPLYPQLPCLPIVECHGRDVRYVEPGQIQDAGSAPSAILFPRYAKSAEVHLQALMPLQPMMRLLEANADLHRPVTETALAEFLRFVEQTPAYELVYSDLSSAKAAVEERL